MAKREDLTGKIFGKLTVIKLSDRKLSYGRGWDCRCECNNISVVSTANLNSGHITGCQKCWAPTSKTHGLAKTKIWGIWQAMKQRCHNPNDNGYLNYGGRGIVVCERWRNSFDLFLADMGLPPSKKHSIDRINNDGNYDPSNCRWATPTEQLYNRRNTIHIEFNGKKKYLFEWANDLGINAHTIWYRLKRGWPIDRALTSGLQKNQYAAE